jgi:NADPH:quinone reductase-like Zn-dependent oxidoreductase
MPHSDTGERVTPVLDFPSRDGLVVNAIRVDYEPAGYTRGTHRHVDRLPAIPSYELSGVVEEVGPGAASVAAGDEVFALTPFDRDGVAADYTALPAELLVARPRANVVPCTRLALAHPSVTFLRRVGSSHSTP